MFNAYPQQRTSCWKFVVPLCLAGGLCLVLYASFEASEDDRPLSSDDPSLKRMQPFLSSQTFEIGLWTRQKPTGDETSAAPETSRSSEEVERLRQQLLLERSRIAEQSAEIARLRGSVTPQPAKTVQDFDPTLHSAADTKETDASIPDSLWREPPLLDKEAASASQLEKQWNYEDSPSQTSGSTRDALKAVEKENTITVKAGDRELSSKSASRRQRWSRLLTDQGPKFWKAALLKSATPHSRFWPPGLMSANLSRILAEIARRARPRSLCAQGSSQL